MLIDLYNQVVGHTALNAISLSADANGEDIDMAGFSAALFVANVGLVTTPSATNYIELEVEVAPDSSGSAGTYVDAADADLIGSVTGTNTGTFAVINAATEDNHTYIACYIGNAAASRQWIRVVVNETGTITSAVVSCSVLLWSARDMPTTQPSPA